MCPSKLHVAITCVSAPAVKQRRRQRSRAFFTIIPTLPSPASFSALLNGLRATGINSMEPRLHPFQPPTPSLIPVARPLLLRLVHLRRPGWLTTGVSNFLARRSMTTQQNHHRAAAEEFPLHSSASSTGSADSTPWHHRAPAMPPVLPFDTKDADEMLLLDMLYQHHEVQHAAAAPTTAPVRQEAD